MPPKRKRTEEGAAPEATATTTRATRSSARVKGQAAATENPEPAPVKTTTAKAAAKAKKEKEAQPTEDETAPSKKKAKTTKAVPKASTKKEKSTTARGKTKSDDDSAASQGTSLTTGPSASSTKVASSPEHTSPAPITSVAVPTTAPEPPTTTAPTPRPPALEKSSKPVAPQPYSKARAQELFGQYADEDEPDAIGPEGFERLCGDADLPMDGAAPLLLAWVVEAKEMAKISRTEWEKGMDELRISSAEALKIALEELQDLLLTNKPAVQPSRPSGSVGKSKSKSAGPSDLYNRTKYYEYAVDRKAAFLLLYGYCFALAKPESSRNIDMETATAFWSVLLAPQYPLATEIVEFIKEKDTYKAVNKDLWTMVLEFCQSVNPNLDNLEEDGAWPTLLDDFVEWKKAKTA